LAEVTGAEAVPLAGLDHVPYDILVNTTSVGMAPAEDATPVPPDILRPGTVVFDAVYTPAQTRLLREARTAGARVVKGTEMFLHQGGVQFRLFTGKNPNLVLMRRVLAAHS